MKARQMQLIMKYSLDGTRDDSPNSVIAHSATLSHTSSASGSMEHHMFNSNPREQRYSISDEALSVECVGISNSFNKADPVDSSAESDLDSAKIPIQKRSTHNTNSERSSPVYKTNIRGTKDSNGFAQSPRLQSTTIDTIKPQGAPACAPKEHSDSPMYSFSEALKECHSKKLQTRFDGNKGSRSTFAEYEDVLKDFALISTPHRFKERKRPASMDQIREINSSSRDGYNYSPKIGNVRESPSADEENPVSPSRNESRYIYGKEDLQKKRHDSQNSASGRVRTFPSPGTPSTSTHSNSWSLERVSMAANSYRNGLLARHNIMYTKNINSNLPSKWDDAEKWLCSPASGDNIANTVHKHGEYSRKPKSKSGPLVAVGPASPARPLYYSKNRASTIQAIQAIHQYSPRSALENGLIGPGIRRSGSSASVSDNLQEQNPSENSSCLHLDSEDTDFGVKSCKIRSASVDGWSCQAKDLPIIETRSVQAAPAKLENSIPELPEQKTRNAGTQMSLNKSQATREILPVPIFSQDKYADMVLETPRLFGSTSSIKRDMVVVQSLEQEECESISISMKDAATEISPTVSRRDMATQITPLGSSTTSRSTTPQKCNSPARHNTPARSESGNGINSTLDVLELPTCHLAKLEIGNGDINFNHNCKHPDQVFTPNPGKKQINSSWRTREEEEEESSKCLRYFESADWRKNIVEARASAWEEAERAKCLARFKREEAKITAWENHQKAKAEAELKKLEVKLEKVRSQTTEKIMNKVATAHKKAEDMRATIAVQQAEQLAKTMDRAASVRRTGHVGTLGACFSFSCNV